MAWMNFNRLFRRKDFVIVFETNMDAVPGDLPVRVEIPEATKRQITEHFEKVAAGETYTPAIFHLPPGVTMRIERL